VQICFAIASHIQRSCVAPGIFTVISGYVVPQGIIKGIKIIKLDGQGGHVRVFAKLVSKIDWIKRDNGIRIWVKSKRRL
jgi:hypothetical protein